MLSCFVLFVLNRKLFSNQGIALYCVQAVFWEIFPIKYVGYFNIWSRKNQVLFDFKDSLFLLGGK